MKTFLLICSSLLFLGVANMPIGYYNFLRIMVTIGAVLIIIQELKDGTGMWVVIFGIVAVLFNPLIPVYLGKKENWLLIDLISAVLFLVKVLSNEKLKYVK
jgi:hypothetical protein